MNQFENVVIAACQEHRIPLVVCPDCWAVGQPHFKCLKCAEQQDDQED